MDSGLCMERDNLGIIRLHIYLRLNDRHLVTRIATDCWTLRPNHKDSHGITPLGNNVGRDFHIYFNSAMLYWYIFQYVIHVTLSVYWFRIAFSELMGLFFSKHYLLNLLVKPNCCIPIALSYFMFVTMCFSEGKGFMLYMQFVFDIIPGFSSI